MIALLTSFAGPLLARYGKTIFLLALVGLVCGGVWLGYRDIQRLHAEVIAEKSQVVALKAQVHDAAMVQAAQMALSSTMVRHDRVYDHAVKTISAHHYAGSAPKLNSDFAGVLAGLAGATK